MAVSDLASLAMIVQGMFFVVSIGLLSYQVRENTRLVKAANTQRVVELFAPFHLSLAQDRALAELWRRGAQHFDELDDIDQVYYLSVLTWWLVLHEDIYHQWSSATRSPQIRLTSGGTGGRAISPDN